MVGRPSATGRMTQQGSVSYGVLRLHVAEAVAKHEAVRRGECPTPATRPEAAPEEIGSQRSETSPGTVGRRSDRPPGAACFRAASWLPGLQARSVPDDVRRDSMFWLRDDLDAVERIACLDLDMGGALPCRRSWPRVPLAWCPCDPASVRSSLVAIGASWPGRASMRVRAGRTPQEIGSHRTCVAG